MRSFHALLAVAALSTACSSTSSGQGTGTSGKDASTGETPAQTCADAADVFAKAAQRCGEDYQANLTAFENAVGGCDKIVAIRDEASLRGTCFSSIATASCANLQAGTLDPSCSKQLLSSSSYEAPIHLSRFASVAGVAE